ncbi:hypothetical protein EDB89DRAFT_382104 [Lactarius sanguifluus]|nr:hypothetical protein EDB89DRAFT_382104 [Lactarius sanguifluus]
MSLGSWPSSLPSKKGRTDMSRPFQQRCTRVTRVTLCREWENVRRARMRNSTEDIHVFGSVMLYIRLSSRLPHFPPVSLCLRACTILLHFSVFSWVERSLCSDFKLLDAYGLLVCISLNCYKARTCGCALCDIVSSDILPKLTRLSTGSDITAFQV